MYMHWAFEEQFPISQNHMAFPCVYINVLAEALAAADRNNRYYLILLLPFRQIKKKGFLTDRNPVKKKHTSRTRSE